MDCNQARALLSAHRELKSGELDTVELDKHLESCASCREALASYTLIGEQMRGAPACVPPADLHAKLMRALADEQMKMLQKSAPGTVSTPEFLKPYLQERAQTTPDQDEMVALSTAKTGPLPVIPMPMPRKRRQLRVNQFAVLGTAAAILLLMMMGGLTSLLILARNNPTSIANTGSSINQPSAVDLRNYSSQTPYGNVVSAIPTDTSIFYSAYGNDVATGNGWMLMQMDRSTQVSTPLLATPGNSPLLLISASQNWLVWLEYDRPQVLVHGEWVNDGNHYSPQRSWSLHYLSLLPQTQLAGAATPAVQTTSQPDQPVVLTSMLLTQGIFDSTTAPNWATTPITGAWLNGDTLLVTQIDQQGLSHLESYRLDPTGANTSGQLIASAAPGHILTWPTTDYTGRQVYWADEWTTTDGVLHSNIWQQQTFEQPLDARGQINNQIITTQQALLTDGLSFQPQVVDNTLFFLSTSEVTVSKQGSVRPNGTPLPTSAINTGVDFTPRADPAIYSAPADAAVKGTLFTIPLDGPDVGAENMLGTVGQAISYQAGSSYVLWRDNTGYQMYDVQHQANVAVGTAINSAGLLMVNGNTALWWANDGSNTASGAMSMTAFNWPN